MKFELPKIYPITDARLTGLSHLEQVERLVRGGARIVQLRDKQAAPKDFYESAKSVVEFARARNVKIIVNDRVDIALAVGADGVHLGQDDLPPEYARKILGEKAIVGFSTHSVEQAAEAAAFPLDYIAVGPVFPTSTKENPDTAIGLETLKLTREIVGDFPLVAIGGIDRENARSVFRGGADSLAIISGILKPADLIAQNMQRFTLLDC